MDVSVRTLVLVAAIAAAAPLLVSLLGRWVSIPLVVFEILLGILLGPQVAGWLENDPYVGFVSTLGLAMLFLLAGYEIDFARIRGRPLELSALGWLGSLVLGVVLGNLLLRGGDPAALGSVESKLDAVGFGFLVPVFFIQTGVTFDVDALFGSAADLVLVPTFLVLFVLVRGIPATMSAPPGTPVRDRAAIALFGATGLPIIVAVTTIGLDHGELHTSTAAALVGAGMLSVLVFPLLALTVRGRR